LSAENILEEESVMGYDFEATPYKNGIFLRTTAV
jgi:hypothetical protein